MKFDLNQTALRVAIGCCFIASTITAKAQAVSWSDGSAINSYYANDNVQMDDISPHIATDGQGNWLGIWAVSNRSETEGGAIKVAHSNDPADHWDAPVIVDEQTTPTYGYSQFDSDVELLFAGNNTWIAYWNDYYSRSTDGGATWSPRKNILSTYSPGRELDSNSSGTIIAVYTISDSPTQSIWIKRSTDYGQTWSAPTAFNIGSGWTATSFFVSISSGGGDKWYISVIPPWSAGPQENGRIYLSSDNGINWTPKGETPHTVVSLEAVNDTVVFESFSTIDNPYAGGSYIYTSLDAGATFTRFDLNDAPTGGSHNALAHDASGNWCFFGYPGYSDKLSLWTSTDALNWIPIADSSTDSMFSARDVDYSICGGNANQFVVGYYGKRNGTSLNRTDDDIVTRSSDTGGTSWTLPIYLNDTFDTDTSMILDSKAKIEYGGGTMIANWSDGTTNHMIARSSDKGQTWTPARILASDVIAASPGFYSTEFYKPIYAGGGNWFIYRKQDCQNCGYNNDSIVGFNSYDAGTTWTQLPLATGNIVASNGSGLLMKSMAVTSGTQSLISISTDLGASWDAKSTIPLSNVASLVHCDGTIWLARDSNDEIIRLENNGATWTSQGTATVLTPYNVKSITSDNNGKLVAACDLTTFTVMTVDLYASVSSDCGANWSIPALVYTETTATYTDELATYAGYKATPEALHVGGDNWIFVSGLEIYGTGAQGYDFYGAYGNSEIALATSRDGGNNWNLTQPVYQFERINGIDSPVSLGSPSFCLAGNKVAVARAEKNVNGPDSDLVLRTTDIPAGLAAARDWQLFD